MPAKRGARSLNWLQVPESEQKKHRKNILSMAKDMEKFLCNDFRVLISLVRDMGFCGEIDMDNSNTEYLSDYSATLTHRDTSLGHAYVVHSTMPGFPATEIFSLQVYHASNVKRLKMDGDVIFRGAFFRFRDLMREQVPIAEIFYNKVVKNTTIFRRSQLDIAIDVKMPVNQKWNRTFIVPHKTSKQVVKPYNYQPSLGGYQSFSYMPSNRRNIGIRIYNKILDIVAKNKQHWYPDWDMEKDTVTRIELVYFTPYSENDDEKIFESARSAILGTSDHNIIPIMGSPRSLYSALSAHKYFSRYAKNHGKFLGQVLDDVTEIEYREEKFNDKK